MLEDVAGEGDVDGGWRDDVRQPLESDCVNLDPGRRPARRIGIEVDRDPPRRTQVIDQLAIPGPQIEDRRVGWDVALQEAFADRSPKEGLRGPFWLRKARCVEAGEIRARGHEVAVPWEIESGRSQGRKRAPSRRW